MINTHNISLHSEEASRSTYLSLIFLFILWPFGLFLVALINYEKREYRFFLVLFAAIFGYSMLAESSGLDLYRVQNSLSNYYNLSFKELINRVNSLYSQESESVDIYKDIVTFLVSRFTVNGKWLMLIYGLVYGYTYTKILNIFVAEQSGKNLPTFVLLIVFSSIMGLDQLAGVRFPLASYVFVIGVIKVIAHHDKRYLVLASLSALIHFSFLLVVLLFFLYLYVLKKLPKLIYVILTLSFILPELANRYLVQFSGYFGRAIADRSETYYDLLNYDLESGGDLAWYIEFRINLMLIFCYLTLIISRLMKKKLNYSERINDLFFFVLVILSFVNFTISIPHLGFRFQLIFLMVAIIYLFLFYAENSKSPFVTVIVFLSIPFSSLMIAYSFRSILYYTPLTLYYSTLPGLLVDKSIVSAWSSLF